MPREMDRECGCQLGEWGGVTRHAKLTGSGGSGVGCIWGMTRGWVKVVCGFGGGLLGWCWLRTIRGLGKKWQG